jgi:chemotaxis protein methyltransferase CheR
VIRVLGCADLRELARRVGEDPEGEAAARVLDALTNHETAWFRGRAFFDMLERRIIPSLVADRIGTRKLRIWSAGCSTGQEPYSLAMMMQKSFPALRSWDRLLLASDVSALVVRRARSGMFSQHELNRGLSAPEIRSHFMREGSLWRIDRAIREQVRFQSFSLTDGWTLMEQFDLILLRNVLIYFDSDVRAAVIRRIRRHMVPGAYLCLGAAEVCGELERQDFEVVELDGHVLLRKPV